MYSSNFCWFNKEIVFFVTVYVVKINFIIDENLYICIKQLIVA